MSLRTRLFLVLASLVAGLVVAQWWLVRSLSEELDRELDAVALTVGGSVASVLTGGEGKPHALRTVVLSGDRSGSGRLAREYEDAGATWLQVGAWGIDELRAQIAAGPPR